jgi:hypothetical protein
VAPGKRLDPDECVVLMHALGFEPKVPYVNTHTPWESKCLECGNDCAPRLADIKKRGGGCPKCALKSRADKRRVDPEQAVAEMREAGIEPSGSYPGAGKPWKGRCKRCDKPTNTTLSRIRMGQFGCWPCGMKTTRNKLRLDEATAWQEMRDAGLEPLEPYPGMNKAWKCECNECGRTVTPYLVNVRHNGISSCPYCAGTRVDPEEAFVTMQRHGAEPCTPYPGNNTVPWPCVCKRCGNDITPTYRSALVCSPCRYCAPYGISYIEPAVVYLLRHRKFQAIKVGIASLNSQYDRIAHHQQNGWEPVASWSTPTGFQAALVEREILDWWRLELIAPPAVAKEQMPQGGHTETVSHIYVGIAATKARIDEAVRRLDEMPQSELPQADEVVELMVDG